jgi:hypothetical protein
MHDEEAANVIKPDQILWNILLFAIKWNQTSIVEYLLTSKEYEPMVNPLSIHRPPKNNQEFHI